ncbi:MAG: type I 3-dehydroquinate dehydratase [Verrucomicrobiota bacterium]
MRQKNKQSQPPVVGIVDSPTALSEALKLPAGSVDFLEWRADCMPSGLQIPRSRVPWILTVRHPREGGMRELSVQQRREIFAGLLPAADLLDVELRSFATLAGIIGSARSRQIRLVASFHDFKKTPSSGKLRDLATRARDEGADIFKLATRTETPADVCRLLDLFQSAPIPLAVMGMGPLGFGSRILFAQCGSVLNYGWLHRPNVPGQWPALELKRILASEQVSG